MSTLKVNTLEEATVGGATFFTAKAWVNFSGTGTVAIRDDGNVSSITDNGTGQYTVNMTNSLTDVNFSWNGTSGITNGTGASYGMYIVEALGSSNSQSKTTTSYKILAVQYQGSLADTACCMSEAVR